MESNQGWRSGRALLSRQSGAAGRRDPRGRVTVSLKWPTTCVATPVIFSVILAQELSAVGAACMLVRREVYLRWVA
jgi:hypothetical protein